MLAGCKSEATLIAPLLLLAGTPATAHVVESGGGGFVIRYSALAPLAPDRFWAALVNPEHNWSGDSAPHVGTGRRRLLL